MSIPIPTDRHITYSQSLVKCGKYKCKKCYTSGGKGHGPYWKAYWRENGKVKSAYVGKTLPGGIQK